MADRNRHIRDVMTPNPDCVSEKDSIRDVARIMKDQDTGVVPVVDGKRIIGLITDRDIVVRGLAEGKNLENVRVNELMTTSVRSVREDASIDEVLNMMGSSEIRRVPVVNSNDELVGIVSLGDIAAQGNKDGKVGKAVENISEAPPNN
ncbi:MAG TPA: CBS domain-containing protein [Thermoanaerobaculia bacterium]|nr:CBS domain-containing protein [Thermoanaerobaculia bacterium]